MVGQNTGHHGIARRHGANADTGVMAAFGNDAGVFSAGGDSIPCTEDRAGGFDGKVIS